jgi:cell wall-associated NlpC family hydrolase
MLTSCSQWKSLTSRDNSTSSSRPVAKKSKNGNVRFLDNINVAPGQASRSKQTMGPAMPSPEKRRKERDSYNSRIARVANSGEIERVDWLQLKYAIALDATVETLNNVNLLKLIDEWFGVSYCTGGHTKDCIDCSAFTHIILQDVYNVNIPRNSREQYSSSEKINLEDLNEGDLVFFTNGGEISHVGVYIQNNKFVHASTSSGVMISDLNDSYWKPRFKAAGRYITNPTPSFGSVGGMK